MLTSSFTIDGIITGVVGLVALYVYWLTKAHEKRSAAIILVMDIRHAEDVKRSVMDTNFIDKNMKAIPKENNWNKYKHLFSRHLSSDDFIAFNSFFESCSDIADARERMVDIFYKSIEEKASLMQQKIFDIKELNTEQGQKEKLLVIQSFNNEREIFDPQEPKARVAKSLQMMGSLSNTSAFEKLKKIAKLK